MHMEQGNVRRNNSEITGRAGGLVLACPSFQAPMWDIRSFKPALIPLLAALTCPRINNNAQTEARPTAGLQPWEEHREGLFPQSRPLRGIWGFAKAARDASS